MAQLPLVDSHCHLHMLDAAADHPVPYLERAREQGIGHLMTVSVDLDSVPELLALAERYPQISTSVGVHPCGRELREVTPDELAAMADHPQVLAIGETGLDYMCTGPEDREWHHHRFRQQVRAARLAGKPVIIHSRGAPEDTGRILKEEGADAVGGIIHCFTDDTPAAHRYLDLGFHISLSGILTFRQADALRKVARKLPQDSLLVETDCPYLAPVPHRGKQNQPAWVREVAECLADIRGERLDAVAEYTTENFYRLFPAAPPLDPQATL
ncbi:TatD family hydrolase [Aquisalimonas sp. 2447]|uniref:TatD family hydrolase n=1 Tax=Aquisalimonas sp. 2447 TaxID=2740807 RepID=UPI0014324CC8|nr:TatD family hydrolase [Aquisalimonas sp. 2447]QIT55500.1 TatD family hydrolase [Aquisalimonas sp. 2447]